MVASNDLIFSGEVYNSGSLTKTGPGHLFLTASNSYSGLTVVQQGILWAQNSWALGATSSGTVVSNGATLVLAGNIGITNESLTLNGFGNSGWTALDCENAETNIWAGPITLAADSNTGNYNSAGWLRIIGPISGPGGLLEDYTTGTLSFEGSAANTYAGTTTVNPGTTLLLNNTSGADGAIPHDLNINGTVINSLREYQINNSSTVTIGPSGLLDLSGIIATNTILASPVANTPIPALGRWATPSPPAPTSPSHTCAVISAPRSPSGPIPARCWPAKTFQRAGHLGGNAPVHPHPVDGWHSLSRSAPIRPVATFTGEPTSAEPFPTARLTRVMSLSATLSRPTPTPPSGGSLTSATRSPSPAAETASGASTVAAA